MSRSLALFLTLVTAILVLDGCGRQPAETPARGDVPTAEQARSRTLTEQDVQMYLAVRNRALEHLEAALAAVEPRGIGVLGGLQDLAAAEQDAARALGFEWQRYRWVREEVARLLSLQREREDARLLALELGRARDDLSGQLAAARDPASRQFLEAQVASLDSQLARLEEERELPPVEREQLMLIEGVRAEIATNQGRQDSIRRRFQELLEESRAAGTPPSPAPGAAGGPTPSP